MLFDIFVIIIGLSSVYAMCVVNIRIEYILERLSQPAVLQFMTLNCNCPCYAIRSKTRSVHRMLFLIVSGFLQCIAVLVCVTIDPPVTMVLRVSGYYRNIFVSFLII